MNHTTPRQDMPECVCRCGRLCWMRPDYAPPGVYFCGHCGAEHVPGTGRVVSKMVRRIVGDESGMIRE